MKKIMALAFALFFATTAAAAESYPASQKIQQTVNGELKQTVYAGDEIKPVTILYENTDLAENVVPEYSSTNFLENFGLSKRWVGSRCEIAGEMRDDIPAGTYNAFIVVRDNEGKFAKTEFEFTVLEKEETLSLKWNKSSGDVNQEVTAGKSITPIVFDYEGITSYSVSGLPSGLVKNIDEKKHKIMIVGSVNSDVMSGDYEYKVTVKNDQGDEKSMSGTIVVKSGKARTSIKLVSEKARQEVVAGNEIEPVVFEFANVHVDESLSSFKFEGSLKGSFAYSVEGNKLTCSGTVDENLKGGLYTIRIIAIGENNNDTAFANVDVIHKSVETKVYVIENETQSLTAGDSIKPIVFKVEHGSNPELTNFPGGYGLKKDGNTVTITGLVEENAKGPYEVVLTVTGADNNASAKATINVAAGVMSFDVIEGSDNQTVVAGQEIVPIVYQYNHVKNIHGTLPANLKMEQDQEKKQVKIYGTVDPEMAAHEYVYSFELTDYYGETKTVTGKINVVASIDENSSSSVTSSSSLATSSSSQNVILSSSEGSSSSSATFNSSSSSVILSSESREESSSSTKLASSSSVASSSSSVVVSSSSAKSSSSTKLASSSSVAASSSSVVVSSSSAKSSSSSQNVILSSSEGSSSSSATFNSSSSSVILSSESREESSSSTKLASSSSVAASSSSVVVSSSSAKSSSSSQNVILSSSEGSSSSSATFNSSSSSVILSSESREESSSSTKLASSSSVAASSSSVVVSSSSAKSSSSSQNVILSSSEGSSSSSATFNSSSSSVILSSESREESSSSTKLASSSSVIASSSSAKSDDKKSSSSGKDGKDAIVAVKMNRLNFSYANNALTVVLPVSSMMRVQVFDLTGHLVESFAESVSGTKNFSLAHLNRGNYLVRVEGNSMVRTARIAVK